MSEHDPHHAAGAQTGTGATPVVNAGDILRDARETYGFSIEEVSQQLKLAPRQVKALEDCEFSLLPGRTFVRGFARNYARLLRLDPQVVLDALPGAAGSNALEAPPLNATAVTMGHLPSQSNNRSGSLRWALPLIILLLLVTAGLYEYFRGDSGHGTDKPVVTTPAPDAGDAGAAASTPGSGTALPNPIVPSPAPDAAGNPPASGDGRPPAAAPAAGRTSSSAPDPAAQIAPRLRGQANALGPYAHQTVARLALH